MNTIESTLTDSEQRELHAWCAEVRATHAGLSRPITADDARLTELQESLGHNLSVAEITPEDLGELYFVHCSKSLPAWPLETPGWAIKTEILSGTYPEMMVQFYGKDWETVDGFLARVELMHVVFVNDFVNHDDTTDKLGDFHEGEAKVYVRQHPEDLPADAALRLAGVLEGAATELSQYSK